MNPYKSLLLPVVLAITLASCGKDEMAKPDVVPEMPNATPSGPGSGTSKIQGTWTFVGVRLIAKATVTVENARTITYTDYTTINNGGTIVIDASKMVSTGFTYTIDAVSKGEYYEDGLLKETMDMPVKMTLPPFGSTTTYKQISADSLHYEAGSIGGGDTGLPELKSDAPGSKISWLGDTLVLSSYLSKTSQSNQSGLIVTTVSSGLSVMKLVKKK